MSKNSDLSSIRLRTEHELSDAFALAGQFLSRAKTTDKDFPFEFSTELFAAVSLEIAWKEKNGTFKDVLDYIADPEWDSTKQMLCFANNTMSDYGRLLVDGHIKTKETHWAHSFLRKISDIPTEVAALILVRQCYAHWLEALQAYYKYCDSVAQQKIAFHARSATSALAVPMNASSDFASIRLNSEHDMRDALALAKVVLSKAPSLNGDEARYFEDADKFSRQLFAATSLVIAYTMKNGTFNDVLMYIVEPGWNSAHQILQSFNNSIAFQQKDAASLASGISALATTRPHEDTTGMIRHCYKQWQAALSEKEKHLNTVNQLQAVKNNNAAPTAQGVSVSAMDRLDEMIGLDGVKSAVRDLINMANYDARRKEESLPTDNAGSLHLVFSGNPGTGKTGVAGLVAEIYKENGLLKRGHIVKVDRKMLMGEHIGKTENIMRKFVEEAMDGVLFIDEAHDLYKKESPNDYGHDVIASLLTTLENNRDRLAVILAVYKDKKEEFFTANQGLISRFPTIIEFDDYDPDALTRILHKILDDYRYYYDDVVKNDLRRQMEEMYRRKNEFFANGRDVRNFFIKIKNQHAKRVAGMPKGTDMQRLLVEDIPNIYPSHLAPCGGSDQKQAGEKP